MIDYQKLRRSIKRTIPSGINKNHIMQLLEVDITDRTAEILYSHNSNIYGFLEYTNAALSLYAGFSDFESFFKYIKSKKDLP